MREQPRVAIIGGGITGLSAASFLRWARSGLRPHITLIEADERLGGKIRTNQLAGMPVEAGPDGFLARAPEATDLCRSLGLEEELVAPAPGPAYLWSRNRLRPIPAGLIMGLPTRLRSVLRSKILSPAGIVRAGMDLALPRQTSAADESIGDLVRRRFGREVLERLVDPLLAGIYAGRAEELSVLAITPELAAVARRHRSLFLAMRASRPAASAPVGPSFLTLASGLQTLVERLQRDLDGVDVRTNAAVTRLVAAPGRPYRIELRGSSVIEADAIILAIPAFAAARLVRAESPVAARELAAIGYASVATVALAYPDEALPAPLVGSGFLVARHEPLLLLGCTWLSTKWPFLAGTGLTLLRCAVGRVGDERWRELDDRALTARVHADLVRTMGLRCAPVEARVTRWERAIPQYAVGHLDRLRQIEGAITQLPGVLLAGSAYRGVGVTSCISQAKAAASQTLDWLDIRSAKAIA
jgi:protoporphyrinogen/coproporphyrinogen III oxidase